MIQNISFLLFFFFLFQFIYTKHGKEKEKKEEKKNPPNGQTLIYKKAHTNFVSNLLHITPQELFLTQIAKISNLHSILPHNYPVARLALEIPRPALDAAVILAAGFVQFKPYPRAWAQLGNIANVADGAVAVASEAGTSSSGYSCTFMG